MELLIGNFRVVIVGAAVCQNMRFSVAVRPLV